MQNGKRDNGTARYIATYYGIVIFIAKIEAMHRESVKETLRDLTSIELRYGYL